VPRGDDLPKLGHHAVRALGPRPAVCWIASIRRGIAAPQFCGRGCRRFRVGRCAKPACFHNSGKRAVLLRQTPGHQPDRPVVLQSPVRETCACAAHAPRSGGRWFSLYPASEDKGRFLDNRSVAKLSRARTSTLREVAAEGWVHVVDVDYKVSELHNERSDLLLDKWHPSRKGLGVVAKIVGQRLADDGLKCSER
jgi:hypothetical protein